MTEKFVEPIAQALRKLDSNKYDSSFYMPFAWGGLESYGLSGFYVDGVKRTLDDSEFEEKLRTVLNANNFQNVCN